MPTRAHETDAGYDLTIIKKLNDVMFHFITGGYLKEKIIFVKESPIHSFAAEGFTYHYITLDGKEHSDFHPYIDGMPQYKVETSASMYTTGIRVKPSLGFHCEIVGRSSISKTGHMLANNIGIIDSDYRGEIMVCLIRRENTPPLQLPAKIIQLIVRQTCNLPAQQVGTIEFYSNPTARGEGGFGSSGL